VVSDIFPLPSAGLSSFEALLDFIFRQAADRPALLALDEYPYLRKIIPGIDSILQSLIDKYRETSRLKLILFSLADLYGAK
jgi:AAA+ ATPase superfamily predicted ATPase